MKQNLVVKGAGPGQLKGPVSAITGGGASAFYLTQKPSEELKLLHVNHQVSGGGAVHLPARLFMQSGEGGGARRRWDWWGMEEEGGGSGK